LRVDEPEVLRFLEGVYEDVKGVRRDLRRDDSIEADLGIDSIAAMEMVIALEEEFGVQLADDGRIAGVRTIGDLIDVVLAPAG
jgi:acyl carrier protein